MSSILERYLDGEYEAVWEELVAGVDRFRQPILQTDALAVARETMHRVRHNLEALVARLTEQSYDFTKYTDGSICDWPKTFLETVKPEVAEILAEIEAITGPLPLSLRVFWEVVGGVDLVGYFPGMKWHWCDPVQLSSAEEFLQEVRDLEEEFSELPEGGPVWVSLGTDALHKANISGGSYCIVFPLECQADFILEQDSHQSTFVSHLRTVFLWGGFPGFENFPNYPTPSEILTLRQGLLPI
jgi:hypothetical protein